MTDLSSNRIYSKGKSDLDSSPWSLAWKIVCGHCSGFWSEGFWGRKIDNTEEWILCFLGDSREVQGMIFVEHSKPSKRHIGLLFYLENTVRWIVVWWIPETGVGDGLMRHETFNLAWKYHCAKIVLNSDNIVTHSYKIKNNWQWKRKFNEENRIIWLFLSR